MATTTAAFELTDRYHGALATLRRRLMVLTGAMWARVPTVSEAVEDEFVAQVVPAVLGGQRHAVSLTDAYMAAYLSIELRHGVQAKGLGMRDLIGAAVRSGTPIDDVYRRSFGAVRHALAGGTAFPEAMASGSAVLSRAAQTDVTLSARAASTEWMTGDNRVSGWRRVTGGTSCALCADAGDQVYRAHEPMPIHPNCGCVAEPVVLGERGRTITRPAPEIHDSPGLADHVDPGAGNTIVKVVEHGELGAVLYAAGDDFEQD